MKFVDIFSKNVLKPALGGVTMVAIDKFINKENNMQRSLYLGGAVAAGFFVGTILGETVPDAEFNMFFSNGRNVQERVFEIGFGTVGSYTINKYVLGNDCLLYTSDAADE